MTQDVLQNTAILEVFEFVERIDAADQRNTLERTVRRNDLGNQTLARLEIAMQAANGHGLIALEPERLPRRAFLEHEWDDAHPDEVRAMDALERLGDNGADAEQRGAFGSPVA